MAGGRSALGLVVLLCVHFHRCGSFNLDVDKPSVFSGPEGSYFGFSVDFFKTTDNKSQKHQTDLDGLTELGSGQPQTQSPHTLLPGLMSSCWLRV
ncbi:hypothetical protein INR49_011592 [Caranx melampygus]|nr:hypothetical protein INR49_011592 [Caranx melampygus]